MSVEKGNRIERDAYRYWLGIVLIHAGSGLMLTKQYILDHIADIKNGAPLEYLEAGFTESEFDAENFQRLPIYEAVAIEIIERLNAYEASGDIRDLGMF